MSKQLICRVLMAPDATVHVAFNSKKTFACTPKLLSKILSTPSSSTLKPKKYIDTTKSINPQDYTLTNIPGLTLLKIYSNLEITCSFPQLFENLFSRFNNKPDDIIDLSSYINSSYCFEEKQLYLKFFCDFVNELAPTSVITSSARMTDDEKLTVLSETYEASLVPIVIPSEENTEDNKNNEDNAVQPSNENKEGKKYPTTPDGERLYTVNEAYRLMGYKYPNGLYSAVEAGNVGKVTLPNSREKYYIPEGEVLRKQELIKLKSKIIVKQPEMDLIEKELSEIRKYAPKTIQDKIASFSGLSSEIIKCIKTMEQYNFYLNHEYKEVHWNTRTALIVDVHPEHVSKRFGISNAELMKEGNAPVIPGTDIVYQIHHVEQDANAPFAIITYIDHTEHDGEFHKKSRPLRYTRDAFGNYEEIKQFELHDKNFRTQSKKFWKEYNDKYAAAGSFENIEGYSLTLDKEKKKDNGKKNK